MRIKKRPVLPSLYVLLILQFNLKYGINLVRQEISIVLYFPHLDEGQAWKGLDIPTVRNLEL